MARQAVRNGRLSVVMKHREVAGVAKHHMRNPPAPTAAARRWQTTHQLPCAAAWQGRAPPDDFCCAPRTLRIFPVGSSGWYVY